MPAPDLPVERPPRPWWRWLLGLLFAFTPAVVAAVLVSQHAVDVPTWDDWERAPLLQKAHDGELTWRDLYAPHIEHRILVPRLLILGITPVSGGDMRYEMGLVFAIVVATGAAVFWLLARSLGVGSRLVFPVGFLVNVVLFSPLQWQNFLWAIQTAFLLPACCVAWALVLVGAGRVGWRVGFVGCLLVALVATHSFGHGVLVWPVVLLAVLLGRGGSSAGRERWVFAAVWLACFAAVAAAYYNPETFVNSSHPSHAYLQNPGEKPPGPAHLNKVLDEPALVGRYFFAMVGNQFTRGFDAHPLRLATVFGAAAAALFGGLVVAALFRWRDRGWWDAALPWLALGGFGVTSCLMVAVGRAGIAGFSRSLSPRYVSMSLYLTVGALVLAVLLVRALVRTGVLSRWRREAGYVFVGFAAAFFMFQMQTWLYAAQAMDVHRQARLHARTDLLLINHFEPDAMWRLDASYDFVREGANALDRLGQLDPPLLADRLLDNFRRSKSRLKESRAAFETFEPAGDGVFRAAGYAELPGRDREHAHGVLLVAENAGGDEEIFAVAAIYGPPRGYYHYHDFEFDLIEEIDRHAWSRWEKFVSLDDLPGSGVKVRVDAWAVDNAEMKAYRLPGTFVIDRATGTVEAEQAED